MAYPTAPRAFFGVHSFTPYSRTDLSFYGTVKVVKSSSLSLSGSLIEQMGGSNKYPWNIEEGAMKAELALKFGEYPDFLFTLFLGKAPTALSAETTGNVSTLTNFYGTSVMNGTNGISGVSATSSDEADLKFGKYVLVALSSNTAALFLSSDVDIGRGNNAAYSSNALKIETVDVSSGNHVSALTGLTFTKAGTPAFTTGDSAYFYVRPKASAGGMTVDVGGLSDQTFPEFGCLVYGQKRGNQELVELECYRCKGSGMPLNFEENAWAEVDVKVSVLYDADLDKVFSVRAIKPSGT